MYIELVMFIKSTEKGVRNKVLKNIIFNLRVKKKSLYLHPLRKRSDREVHWKYWNWQRKLSKKHGSYLAINTPNFFETIHIINYLKFIQWRVWSWLRMNASGRLNTCKSRGNRVLAPLTTGARVSNAYATYLLQGDSQKKFWLIPHNIIDRHWFMIKVSAVKDGHAFY